MKVKKIYVYIYIHFSLRHIERRERERERKEAADTYEQSGEKLNKRERNSIRERYISYI